MADYSGTMGCYEVDVQVHSVFKSILTLVNYLSLRARGLSYQKGMLTNLRGFSNQMTILQWYRPLRPSQDVEFTTGATYSTSD